MSTSIPLLEIDPDLGMHLSSEQRAQATIRLSVVNVARGPWSPPNLDPGTTGLIVVSGLLARRIHLGPASSTELIGHGDIIRPQRDELPPMVAPVLTDWRVLEDVQLGVIARRATTAIGAFPELSVALAGRLIRRATCLSYLMAAQHFLRVEDRLMVTLWHLAVRWGHVTPRGTVVPFHLTHGTLAGIIGAQRPTTTTALRSLSDQGRIRRDERRFFVLCGEPPNWETPRDPVVRLGA